MLSHCSPFTSITYNDLSYVHIFFSFSALFTPCIHPVRCFPLQLISLTSDPTIFFTNGSSSILSMCLNHLNTLCSTRSSNSYNINPPSHLFNFLLVYTCYSTHTPQAPHLFFSTLLQYFMLQPYIVNLTQLHTTFSFTFISITL